MAPTTTLFYVLAAVSLLVALLGFLVLGDIVQFVVAFPRQLVYRVFRLRWVLMLLGFETFVATLALGVVHRPVSGLLLGLYALLFLAFFCGGFVVPIYVMFPSQRRSARFRPVAEVGSALPDDIPVLALAIGGDARAFPLDWIMRPHIAGDRVGGEDVVMTYCALSHLGVAYR
ncbi:MAG TPA: DUF3179 domain-containing (seleno)protein, partial [Thermoanaerobaculia bacterium]|nr:DUF3179 domain-containing (seleno)protein [Thermoanaerobaculia bacterium]